MKKIYAVSMLLLATSAVSQAQVKKGALLLGGQAGYSTSDNYYGFTSPPVNATTQEFNSGIFNISAGHAIKENTVVGINLGYSTGKSKSMLNNNPFYKVNIKQYSAGLFYRKYKKLVGELHAFGELDANYFYSKGADNDLANNTQTTIKGNGAGLGISPGLSYDICKKLQLNLLLPNLVNINYMAYKTSAPIPDPKQQTFNVNTSLNGTSLSALNIGFRLVL